MIQSLPLLAASLIDSFLFIPIHVGATLDNNKDSSPTDFGECHDSTNVLVLIIPAYPLEIK